MLSSFEKARRDAYRKLMKCAYEMALQPTMPHKHVSVLVKCLKENNVRLIERKEDGRTGREFVHCIAEAVKEKCAVILGSTHFMSLLSDGSQARKTGKEKELVLIRCERNGIPTYMVLSLLEMQQFGGSNADAIKKAIDSLFERPSKFDIPKEQYRNCLVSCTADGASVNMGKYSGVLTQMKNERPWLLTIHCANHRIELAVKSAFDIPAFKDVEEFYKTNFYLAKNSGKIKGEVSECAKGLGIDFYVLPKIHGTRFIGHRRRGFKVLLETWPAYVLAYENVQADTKGHTANVRSKVSGLLKKFRSYQFLSYVNLYLDLLDGMVPTSLLFEADMLLPFEVQLAISRSTFDLEEKLNEIGTDGEFIDSYMNRFEVSEDGEFAGMFVKAGDKRKHEENRQYLTINATMQPFSAKNCFEKVWDVKRKVISALIKTLKQRFEDYDDEVYSKMRWMDPQFWSDESDYGNDDIVTIAMHFEEPLVFAAYDQGMVLREWKSFKNFVRSYFPKSPSAKHLWKSVLTYRRDEFPNLCKMASLILSISGSNSKVERTFSTVSNILSDKRLSMSHNTLNNNLIVYGNHSLWNKDEREEIIERALDMYLKSKRRMKISNQASIQTLKEIQAPLMNDSSESEDSDVDEIEELFEAELELE